MGAVQSNDVDIDDNKSNEIDINHINGSDISTNHPMLKKLHEFLSFGYVREIEDHLKIYIPKHIKCIITSLNVIDWNNFFEFVQELHGRQKLHNGNMKIKDRRTEKMYGMKQFKKYKFTEMLFNQECQILQKLSGHPNIPKYIDSWMDHENYYILTNLCTEQLFILNKDKLPDGQRLCDTNLVDESAAVYVIRSLLEVISYYHQKDIVHRGLCPQHILLNKDKSIAIITDFADATQVEQNEEYVDFCASSVFYLAPESIRRRKGWELKKSDMWSIGVITYEMVVGTLPFDGKDHKEILTKIVREHFDIPDATKVKLSTECKHFIWSLLIKFPNKRLSALDALKHPWITKTYASSTCKDIVNNNDNNNNDSNGN